MTNALTVTEINVPAKLIKIMVNKRLAYPIAYTVCGSLKGTLMSDNTVRITETNEYGEVSYPMLTKANKAAWDSIIATLKAI